MGRDDGLVLNKTELLREFVDLKVSNGFTILSEKADAFVITDLQGMIQYISSGFERLTGMSISELSDNFHDLFPGGEDLKGLFSQVTIQKFDAQLLFASDEVKEVSVTTLPIFLKGTLIGKYILFVDISSMIRVERKRNFELSQLSEKLSAAGQLSAGIAHEIRNPITAIKGFLQIIKKGYISFDKYYMLIMDEINRIETIINELLVLAKPHQIQGRELHDVKVLVEQTVKLMGPYAILNNIVIKRKFRLASTQVFCEDNQIKQVLINLIKNAIEAMPNGGKITVTAENAGSEVLVRIEDQGPGIPQQLLEKIGSPFFTTKENGTGLGIVVSQQIIENHQGLFSIESDPNGTRVCIRLPISESQIMNIES